MVQGLSLKPIISSPPLRVVAAKIESLLLSPGDGHLGLDGKKEAVISDPTSSALLACAVAPPTAVRSTKITDCTTGST